MMTLLEMMICLLLILIMFQAVHILCLIGFDQLVTYFSNKKLL